MSKVAPLLGKGNSREKNGSEISDVKVVMMIEYNALGEFLLENL